MSTSSDPRPLPIMGKPWFWVITVVLLMLFPLIKSLTSGFPDAPPGHDRDPVQLRRMGYDGREVGISDLGGYLLVVSELPITDKDSFERVFEEWRTLKKRLKGLGFAVNYVQLVYGGNADKLRGFLDEKKGQKVSNIYMMDPERTGLAQLRKESKAPVSDYFLLDSHGRIRGKYPTTPGGLTQLVFAAGVLANWRGSDPALGEPIQEK